MALFGKYKNNKSDRNERNNEPDIYTRLFEDAEKSRRDTVKSAFRDAGLSDEQFQKYYVSQEEMSARQEQSSFKFADNVGAQIPPTQLSSGSINVTAVSNNSFNQEEIPIAQCPEYHPHDVSMLYPPMETSKTELIDGVNPRLQKSERANGRFPVFGVAKSIGRRSSQQDALAVSDTTLTAFNRQWFAVLCDGMGGMSGGERASALCVKLFLKSCMNHIDDVIRFYNDLLPMIDEEVASLKNENGGPLGGGSTFISVCVDKGLFYWASVGDSHIYFIRNNSIVRINVEHNYMADLLEMVNDGEITYEEACADKNKDALTSYMGIGNLTLVDICQQPIQLVPGDRVLLCSDGLYRSATSEEIMQIILRSGNDMQAAANELINFAMAKNNPYQDNTSVVVIRYE